MNLLGEIGIILNLMLIYFCDEYNEVDVNVVKFVDGFFNCLFLDLVVKGYFLEDMVVWVKVNDLLLEIMLEDLVIIVENIVDLLGVNYY